jgi:hypothetical protein
MRTPSIPKDNRTSRGRGLISRSSLAMLDIRLLSNLKSAHPNRNFPGKSLPFPCHPDRSVPGFPTSRRQRRPRVRLSVKRAACRSSTPRVSTGNPGERSGEICGSLARLQTRKHIRFNYVVTFEAHRIFDDSRNRNLLDPRQQELVLRKLHGMGSIRRIHHAHPISTTCLKRQLVNIRTRLAIDDPVNAAIA